MKFVYLASPYSHPDQAVMKARFDAACAVTAKMMGHGTAVFSPIAHSHPLADHMDERLRTDFEFWMDMDLPILRFADQLCVLMLDGWERSRGIAREVEYAEELGIEVQYVKPENWL